MIKRLIKKILAGIVGSIPLDWLLRLSQKCTALIATAIFIRDWRLQVYGWPQFFKHQINLSKWMFEPFRWSFTARGVYAREQMFPGCNVLDLCCGDGSYSFLFFSDIAGKIDAVDNDQHALDYAQRFFNTPTIKHYKVNIVEDQFPATHGYYDVVVWNAAMCYFSEPEIKCIIYKIINSCKAEMKLCGMLPKGFGYVDHKFEFGSKQDLETFFSAYFKTIAIKEVVDMPVGMGSPSSSFYFCVSSPIIVL